MKVTHNLDRTAALLTQMRNSFGLNVRDGIHLSDLLNPRRSYWARVLPMPPTDDEVLYWTAGRGHEDALGRIAGLDSTPQQFYAVEGGEAISYRPDFTWQGLKAEFKTRRANLAQEGEETVVYDSYLDQILGYCSIENERRATLIVFSLLEGRSNDPLRPTHPEIRVYDVEFTQQELDNKREELLTRRADFERELVAHSMEQLAAAAGDRLARIERSAQALCKAWMCGKPTKVVDEPEFCRTCNKAITHRPGALRNSHDVTPKQAHWEYVARCKYYGFCRPQDVDPTRGQL